MADDAQLSDDISALWGSHDGPLEAARNGAPAWDPERPDPVPSNGSHSSALDQDPFDQVATLAGALAAHQVDVVSKTELAALRSEMEGAFTHQLAVAIYELLAASNEGFTRAEDHIDARLGAIADRLAETVAAHHQLRAEEALAVWAELAAMREQLAAAGERPGDSVDALLAFQREMRHEVGRLGDMVAAQGRELGERAQADAASLADQRAGLWARLERSEAGAAEAARTFGDTSGRIAALQDDVSALGEAVRELRAAVDSPRWKKRGRGRRNAER